MANSNIRTLTVRLSAAEHRLLSDFAAAQGLDLEALVREALALQPIETHTGAQHLQLVHSASQPGGRRWTQEHAVPGH